MGTGTFVSFAAALLLALSLGCEADGPPEGFFDECATDDDCTGDWQCLPYVEGMLDGGVERLVCTRRCRTVDDCPSVPNDHCGDRRQCALGQGVCAIAGCR